MKNHFSNVVLGICLVLFSVLLYGIQIVEFHDSRNTFFYLLQDMAFLPLQVAIVTIILNKILNAREKQERLKKMNMVISAFFSEVGTGLIFKLMQFSENSEAIQLKLHISGSWKHADFQSAKKSIKEYEFLLNHNAGSLEDLKEHLIQKRYFQLSLLNNPNLLEHDTFTDMLWASFHLTEELEGRDGFVGLPENDLGHISIDMKRAFGLLLIEWISYMEHLKTDYPYLFSLAIRKNPFNYKGTVLQ